MPLDLASYDVIEISTSAGKDSLAMLTHVTELARHAGVLDRVVAVHADLGRFEWPGTRELAEVQARHLGVRFLVVKRPQGDLFDLVRHYRHWPKPNTRYCTAMLKRAQIHRALTRLANEVRASWPIPARPRRGEKQQRLRPVRVLNCIGLRAEESPGRAAHPALERDKRSSGRRKVVDIWLPIQAWTEAEVWAACRASGAPIHPAYAAGLPRASCVLCLAGETEVVTRAGLRPIRELAGGTHPLLVPKVTSPPGRTPGLHSHGTFVDVPVRSFGGQPLWRIHLRRARQTKVVYATADHRWMVLERELRTPKRHGRRAGEHNGYELVTRDRSTLDLRPGDTLRALKAQPMDQAMAPIKVPFAIAQGFIYGDGSVSELDERPACLTIHDKGKDRALLPYFAMHDVREVKGNGNGAWHINGLPRRWKGDPSLDESRSFLLSWLAGYFAADGCVSTAGLARISSASLHALWLVRSIAAICGIGYGPIMTVIRRGFPHLEPSPLHGVTLRLVDLPDWFFLIEEHRRRADRARQKKIMEDFTWKVVRVEPTDRAEEVFCAEVPKAHAFGLADGLMTGNCIYAPREALIVAGRLHPELLAEYVAVEREIQHDFKHRLPIAKVAEDIGAGVVPAGAIANWRM